MVQTLRKVMNEIIKERREKKLPVIEFEEKHFEIVCIDSYTHHEKKEEILKSFNKTLFKRIFLLVSCRTLLEGYNAEYSNFMINLYAFIKRHWEV